MGDRMDVWIEMKVQCRSCGEVELLPLVGEQHKRRAKGLIGEAREVARQRGWFERPLGGWDCDQCVITIEE